MDNLTIAAIFAVVAMIAGVVSLVIAAKNKKLKAEKDKENK